VRSACSPPRGILYPLFGLSSPLVLDVLALGLLAYAGALVLAAARRPISRPVLMFFTLADGAWVVGSAIVLLSFWGDLAPVSCLLVIAVAVVVEVFATLQFRAAGAAGRPQMIPGPIGSL
jgi:hypothetical protein